MRYSILIIAFLFSISYSFGQMPVKDGKVEYESIVDVTGTKSDLYTKAKQAIVELFFDAKSVIQMDDKEAGKLVGKGTVFCPIKVIGVSSGFYSKYTISVEVKDNKYRLRLYDITIDGLGGSDEIIEAGNKKSGPKKKGVDSAHEKITGLIDAFKKKMVAESSDF